MPVVVVDSVVGREVVALEDLAVLIDTAAEEDEEQASVHGRHWEYPFSVRVHVGLERE